MKRTAALILVFALLLSGCAVGIAADPPAKNEDDPVTVVTTTTETEEAEEFPEVEEAEPEPEPEPLTPEKAAETLNILGIMKGIADAEGRVDNRLDMNLNRETALVLIVRALGHDDPDDEAYPDSGFTDVDGWAKGAVNFAKAAGITKGISATELGSRSEITAREFSTLLLRALGYEGDFEFETAYEYALERGVVAEITGDGVTRGDAAMGITTLLSSAVKGSEKPILASLVEMGKLTRETAAEAGLEALADAAEDGLLSGAEVLAANSDKLFTLSVYDRSGALLRTVHGTFIGNFTAICAYDDIYGAAKLIMTACGADYEIMGMNWYDERSGLVCLNYYAPSEPFPHFEAPADAETENVYVLSSVASASTYDGGLSTKVAAARPVVDAKGNYLGVTTRASNTVVKDISVGYNFVSMTEFGTTHWPDLMYPRGLDPTKKMIAITFDDGPSRTMTPKFLDLLEKYGVVATFFEAGNMLKANPQFLERMEALGCEVANHTYSHTNLNSLTTDAVIAQVEDTNAIIESKLGHKAALVRAPYGNSNATVRSVMDYPLIYWTLDTRDWESRNSEEIYKMITSYSYDGCIILMHSLYDFTCNACVRAIPWLIEQGYQLVTVSEMAECRGYDLEPGVIYYSFPQK